MKTPAELRLKSGRTLPPCGMLKSRNLGPHRGLHLQCLQCLQVSDGAASTSERRGQRSEESRIAPLSCRLKVNCWRGRVLHGDDGLSRILDGPIL